MELLLHITMKIKDFRNYIFLLTDSVVKDVLQVLRKTFDMSWGVSFQKKLLLGFRRKISCQYSIEAYIFAYFT